MKVTAIVPAAGAGRRMKTGEEKPYLLLGGRPIIARTLLALARSELIDGMVVVVGGRHRERTRALIKEFSVPRVLAVVAGGATRTESVGRGLAAVPEDTGVVLIHDGARPLVSPKIVEKTVAAAAEYGAAVAAVPVTATVKNAPGPESLVEATLDRTGLWLAQTPQCFRTELIREAYRKAAEEKIAGGDDAFLVERLGRPVKIVAGSGRNLKITTPEDLALAELILKQEEEETGKGKR